MNTHSRQLPPMVLRLVDDLNKSYAEGKPITVEELLAHHQLEEADVEVVIPLVYEELCLREEHGEIVDRMVFLKRFPRWKSQLEVLLECDELIVFPMRNVQFPSVGGQIGDFQLIAELGRGAAGRVFLSKQKALSDRFVVLKVTHGTGDEHLSLARLQHSGIVPIYLIQEFPNQGLRALCMPYLGGRTLAEVLNILNHRPPQELSGKDIADILEAATDVDPEIHKIRGPAFQFLTSATYAQAVCWIGACLADALHYAHERGLLHLDVKPTNVLLASDGQPMLLDFHLARESCEIAARRVECIGGTAGYMAPEQQQLLDSMRNGHTSQLLVDRRSDIYALGVLLNEMMNGRLSIEEARPSANNNDIGIRCVIERSLQLDPNQRFQSMEEVSKELRRCLVQPSNAINELSEQTPTLLLSRLPMIWALACVLSLLSLGTVLIRTENAKVLLAQAKGLTRENETIYAARLLQNADERIAWIPGFGALRRKIREQLKHTTQVGVALQLHSVVDQLRFLDGARTLPDEELRYVASCCEQVWDRREKLIETLDVKESLSGQEGPRTDLLELAMLWTDLRIRLASDSEANQVRMAGVATLLDVNSLFGKTPVVCQEIARHLKDAGLTVEAEKYAAMNHELPQTAWEHYSLGRSLMQAQQFTEAETEFRLAITLSPDHFWYQFYAGVVAFRLRNYSDAISAFGACIALEPQRAQCYYNRGLAFSANKQSDRAETDFARAQRLTIASP